MNKLFTFDIHIFFVLLTDVNNCQNYTSHYRSLKSKCSQLCSTEISVKALYSACVLDLMGIRFGS